MRERVLTPQDISDARKYFIAQFHFAKRPREEGDIAFEMRELAGVSEATVLADTEHTEIADGKIEVFMKTRNQKTLKTLAGFWRQTHPKKQRP